MTTNAAAPFILVDGSSYLFRAFHALPPLTNSKGVPTGAVYGVINMLRKLMLDYKPKHIAVVFDCKEKTFRHDLFPEYKANRVAMPPELAVQIQPLHDIIRAMGLPLIAIPGVEADDVIGTLAKQACDAGLQTVISTGDKDMAQLVDDHITLVNTMSGTVLDRAGVFAKFEVTPEQMIDYLSLIGDSVDNIPGVYKVGPKTAVKWLQTYHSLEQIINHAAEISGKVGENLRNTIPQLPLYKELITIKIDVPLTIHPRDLVRGTQDTAALKQLFTDLEFRTWLKQLEELSPESTDITPKPVKSHTYELVTDKNIFDAWIDKLSQAPVFAIDIQTSGLNYMDANLLGVSFAITPGQAAYVPMEHISIEYVLKKLQPLLENPQHLKISHNFKYIIEVMANYGIKVAGTNYDVMLASYVLNSVASRHNIDALAMEYLDRHILSYEDIVGKGAKQISFEGVPLDKATEYAAEHVDIILQLWMQFTTNMSVAPRLQSVFYDIEMPLVAVLAAMERRGVLIDTVALKAQSHSLGAHLHTLEQQAYTLAGQEFNLGSPKQLQEVLFEKLQLPIIEKTPTGQPSTGEAVLQELALNYELPKLLLEHRSLSKLKSTYTDKLPLQVNVHTGRVHTSYQQAVTATGRLSSTDPNLQNIPTRNAEGKKIRAAFIAPQGYKIVSADYSQIELRIMAHLSGDKALIDTFKHGLDVHRATAAEVFGVALDQVTDEQRRHSKAINFGLIYGMSAFGLAKQIGSDRATAEHYIETYFQRFPGVKAYMESTRKLAAAQGYVETLYGRRLYLPDINSSKVMLRRAAERAAINAPLQGAQSDIIKKAMIAIFAWLQTEAQDAYMIMQVHDELVFEIPESKVAAYSQKIRDFMANAAQLHVSLDVGIGVGDNWDEAH